MSEERNQLGKLEIRNAPEMPVCNCGCERPVNDDVWQPPKRDVGWETSKRAPVVVREDGLKVFPNGDPWLDDIRLNCKDRVKVIVSTAFRVAQMAGIGYAKKHAPDLVEEVKAIVNNLEGIPALPEQEVITVDAYKAWMALQPESIEDLDRMSSGEWTETELLSMSLSLNRELSEGDKESIRQLALVTYMQSIGRA